MGQIRIHQKAKASAFHILIGVGILCLSGLCPLQAEQPAASDFVPNNLPNLWSPCARDWQTSGCLNVAHYRLRVQRPAFVAEQAACSIT